jgi:hypothetical protein
MQPPAEWTLGLHRTILIAVGAAEARGVLHDDFHHFRVSLKHDGETVRAVTAQTRRGPYSLCSRAGKELAMLEGLSLSGRIGDTNAAVSARLQCTHQLDLAGLVIAAAARGAGRRYGVSVSVAGEERFAGLVMRDGEEVLAWQVQAGHIVDPGPFAGRSIGAGFAGWVADELPDDLGEAALVLRRCCVLARSRRHIPRLDSMTSAPLTGNCWVQQPGSAERAKRLRGVVRDYSAGAVPDDPEDLAWLAEIAPTGH